MDGADGLDSNLIKPRSFNNLAKPQVLLHRSITGRYDNNASVDAKLTSFFRRNRTQTVHAMSLTRLDKAALVFQEAFSYRPRQDTWA
jgi:hypothetical protein